MPVLLCEAIADAITQYEGWKAGSRSNRNRNPGNLRPSAAGQPVDAQGYRIFSTLADGYNALKADIASKLCGADKHGIGPRSTLNDFFKVYAPSADDNDPLKYAGFVSRWLEGVYTFHVNGDTTIAQMQHIATFVEPASGVTAA